MTAGLKQLTGLKPLPGFAPRDESKLANVKLRLNGGRARRVELSERSFQAIGRAEGAAAQLERLPAQGEAIHCILDGSYALFDFIPAVIKLAGASIDELHIATLSFSKKNVDSFAALAADGLIRRLTILCSHYFAAQDREIYDHAAETLNRDGFRLVAMRTHAKVLLIRAGRLRLVVESSANARSCHNVEQATMIRHDDLYDFHRQWIEDLVEKGSKA